MLIDGVEISESYWILQFANERYLVSEQVKNRILNMVEDAGGTNRFEYKIAVFDDIFDSTTIVRLKDFQVCWRSTKEARRKFRIFELKVWEEANQIKKEFKVWNDDD